MKLTLANIKELKRNSDSPLLKHVCKAAYVERNYHMIDKADLCIFYYNENYEPPQKPMSRKHNMPVPTYKRNSGTKTAYEYAVKRKKEIINLYTLLSQ